MGESKGGWIWRMGEMGQREHQAEVKRPADLMCIPVPLTSPGSPAFPTLAIPLSPGVQGPGGHQ